MRAAGFAVVLLPGASAAVTALSVAGDWAGAFTFAGFLPPKAKQRATALQGLVSHPYALVFYEAPHRIAETVAALADAFGPARRLLIARDHQATRAVVPGHPGRRTDPAAGDANRQRGEFVLVVEGAPATSGEADDTAHDALLAAAGRGAGEERGQARGRADWRVAQHAVCACAGAEGRKLTREAAGTGKPAPASRRAGKTALRGQPFA